jgi:hypothetical protein
MASSPLTRIASLTLLVSIALAGCGGGKSTSTTSTTTSTAPQAAATSEAQRETAALPQNAMQPVPSDLNCGAVKPVWVNLRSKAYHESDDPYYGRTKNGKYMCPSAAQAAGYHPAGSEKHHHHKGSSMNMNAPSPEPT